MTGAGGVATSPVMALASSSGQMTQTGSYGLIVGLVLINADLNCDADPKSDSAKLEAAIGLASDSGRMTGKPEIIRSLVGSVPGNADRDVHYQSETRS